MQHEPVSEGYAQHTAEWQILYKPDAVAVKKPEFSTAANDESAITFQDVKAVLQHHVNQLLSRRSSEQPEPQADTQSGPDAIDYLLDNNTKSLRLTQLIEQLEALSPTAEIGVQIQLSQPDIGVLLASRQPNVEVTYDNQLGIIYLKGTRAEIEETVNSIHFYATTANLPQFWINATVVADHLTESLDILELSDLEPSFGFNREVLEVLRQPQDNMNQHDELLELEQPVAASSGTVQLGELTDPIHVTYNPVNRPVIPAADDTPVSASQQPLILSPSPREAQDPLLTQAQPAADPAPPAPEPPPASPPPSPQTPEPITPDAGGGATGPANNGPTVTIPGPQTLAEDGSVTVSGAAVPTFADADGDTLSVTLAVNNGIINLGDPAAVTITTGSDGTDNMVIAGTAAEIFTALNSFTYIPGLNYNGTDNLTLSVDDGNGGFAMDFMEMVVTPVDDAPVAIDDSASTAFETPLVIDVTDNPGGLLANDEEYDGEALTITAFDAASADGGLVVDNADGTFTYTPAAGYTGSDSFTYTISDGTTPVTATVTIGVSGALLATNTDATEHYTEDTALNLVNDIVISGSETNVTATLSLSDTSAGTFNTATSGAVTATFAGGIWQASGARADVNTLLAGLTFTPAADYDTDLTVDVSITDGVNPALAGTLDFTATPVNDAPVASADSYAVDEGDTLSVSAPAGVLANDTDAEGDSLDAVQVTGPSHGALTLNADGSFTYVHDGGEDTADSFTYRANDGSTDSNIVTVDLTIGPVNDAPENTVPGGQNTTAGTPLPLSGISVSDADDTSLLSFSVDAGSGILTIDTAVAGGITAGQVTNNGTGNVTVSGATLAQINATLAAAGGLVFTPAVGFTGNTTVTVTSNDGSAVDSDTITVTTGFSTGLTASLYDILPGSAAADTYSGQGDHWHDTDTVIGGNGYDILDLTAGGAASVSLTGGHFTQSQEIEEIRLGDAGHTITIGDDYFTRGSGIQNDRLQVDGTANTSDATVDGGALSSGYELVLTGGSGDDVLSGGAGNDTISGDTGGDSIDAGGGDDDITLTWNSGGSGGSPITTDLVVQLDASDTSTITTHPGTVTAWDDLSTANNDAASDAGSPDSGNDILGLNSIAFDGSSWLQIGDSADINTSPQNARSIFVTFETDATDITSQQVIFEQGGKFNGFNIYIEGGRVYMGAWKEDGSSFSIYHSAPVVAGTTYTAGLVFDHVSANHFTGYLDGTVIGSSAITQDQKGHSGDIGVGGVSNDSRMHSGEFNGDGSGFKGEIGELLNYDGALNSAEASAVSDYLLGKWHGVGPNDTILGGAGDDTLAVNAGGDPFTMNLDGTGLVQGVEYLDLTQSDAAHTVSVEDGYFSGGTGVEGGIFTIDATGLSTGVSINTDNLTGGHATRVFLGEGDDTLIGGDGTDVLSFIHAAGGIDFNLDDGTISGQGNDSISGIEYVIGSAFDDTLIGNSRIDETLIGGNGDDRLEGDDLGLGSGSFTTTNLRMHLDASNLGSITAPGNNVSLWNDLSSDNNDATAAAGNVKSNTTTINDLNSLFFDGSSDLGVANDPDLNASNQNERSLFAVFETDSDITSRQMIYEQGGGVNGFSIYIYNSNLYMGAWKNNGSDFAFYDPIPIETNTTYVVGSVFDTQTSNSYKTYVNGVEVGSQSVSITQSSHPGNIQIGEGKALNEDGSTNAGFFQGELGELLNYEYALTPTEATDLQNYLLDKWNPFGSRDSLDGGDGNDTITGGMGVDTMLGGGGDDRFVFERPEDSETGAGDRDIIADFNNTSQADRIDLSALGVISQGSGGAAALTAGAAQFAWGLDGSDTVVFVDSDGDNTADMEIEISGLPALSNADFIF